MGKKLKNKPLVEAIFELRWELGKNDKGLPFDNNYDFLIGLFNNNIKNEFGTQNKLELPFEGIPYVPHYQFRKKPGEWPVIQLGLGLLTVNDTSNYEWEDNFNALCKNAVDKFYASYPDLSVLQLSDLTLRYINAIKFDYQNSILDFMKSKLKIDIALPNNLFENGGINKTPLLVNTVFSLPINKPKGAVIYNFNRGKKDNIDSLLWEIVVTSRKSDIIKMPDNINAWLNEAHEIAEKSFFTMIEGDLEKDFEND